MAHAQKMMTSLSWAFVCVLLITPLAIDADAVVADENGLDELNVEGEEEFDFPDDEADVLDVEGDIEEEIIDEYIAEEEEILDEIIDEMYTDQYYSNETYTSPMPTDELRFLTIGGGINPRTALVAGVVVGTIMLSVVVVLLAIKLRSIRARAAYRKVDEENSNQTEKEPLYTGDSSFDIASYD